MSSPIEDPKCFVKRAFTLLNVSGTTFLLADIERYELPIRGVFLVNATVSPNYQVIFAIETYAIIINCWWVYSFDTVLLGLVRWITIDLKILQLNYRQCQFFYEPRGTLMVTQEGFNAVKNYSFNEELKNEDEIYNFVPFDEKQVNVKVDSFLKRFTSCLSHQQQVLKNIKDVNNLFSLVLAIQTISNCTLTCMGLFGLVSSIKKHNNPANDIVMLQIGFLNLLYWCFFGHMLIIQHDCLIDSIYECGWEEYVYNKDFIQVMIITIIHGMRPMVIKAGHFFDLSMNTYLAILLDNFYGRFVTGSQQIILHERLSKTVYACGWENYNGRKIKPVVVFGLYQTLTPMVMKAGYFFVFGMETYLSVIQKAYSYFAILNTMMTD
ncbi:Protein of unknown function [Cotesia congregata]|uniref:Odorant receptor n=1 Tax=Cotesia congregata TaxID=51543 RepID=A0A8J2HB35_COTCN|nr:Protein of unknown function [Cotesia congregata]